jgi:uncharacterized membrane protein YidH (DUF202 family)
VTATVPGRRFSLLALLAAVGTCAVLLAATHRMLGLPDMSLVREFTGGSRPSNEAALATASLLVWTAVVTVCAWLILTSCEGLLHTMGQRVRPLVDPGVVVMVIGICLLGIAAARHMAQSPQMCCGSIQEASQNLGH